MLRPLLALTAATLFLIGCATPPLAKVSARPVTLPDGRQGYDVRCNGTHHDIGDCMNEAARACGGPYQIVTQNGEVVGGAAMATPVGNGAGAVMVHGMHRTMIVECGAASSS